MPLPAPTLRAESLAFRHGDVTAQTRAVPEEVAVALSYDQVGYAVMMATPCDLIDFAIGFSLSEGIVDQAADILRCEIVTVELGVECRMRLAHDVSTRLAQRRRHLAGALGCGLCGLESLAQANRAIPQVASSLRVSASSLMRAMHAMSARQMLNRATHGVHAAGFFDPASGDVLVREDVGRHNALDKITGALARKNQGAEVPGGDRPGSSGVVLLTSRVSIELIQKAAMLGAPVVAAVSVPTAYAIRAADRAGITLAAVARDDGFEVFTHQSRIAFGDLANVA
ncbi:MAG: formate dehydrogenase accessory sulfurtransferase FdhD [Acidiphilium sp.]|nr:formate dehydrogenase accessory sulfurtransferase FdhD [Acidiphilium sp.]MDD4935368.1 formate dehydrogenase accessory sulfurtransferase FdhD [Acidiphilium sp.]